MTLVSSDADFSHYPIPNDNWRVDTSVLNELPGKLCSTYGEDSLTAKISNKKAEATLREFVLATKPEQVFDVIELFYNELRGIEPEKLSKFQSELNEVFFDEDLPWRLVDGEIFKVDSEFLAYQLVENAQSLLKTTGFAGAYEEFRHARSDLTAGDTKGAIHNACKSVESALKTLLKRSDGTAKELIDELVRSGFVSDLPENVRNGFATNVLMSLPYLRNRLGGHGQGSDSLDVPYVYGELSIHLAAAFIQFLLRQHLSKQADNNRAR